MRFLVIFLFGCLLIFFLAPSVSAPAGGGGAVTGDVAGIIYLPSFAGAPCPKLTLDLGQGQKIVGIGDSHGFFFIADVPAGSGYTLTAEVPFCPPRSKINIDVSAGSVSSVSFSMRNCSRNFSFTGTVFENSTPLRGGGFRPIEGVNVSAKFYRKLGNATNLSDPVFFNATTDSSGVFIFNLSEEYFGWYSMNFTKEGFVFKEKNLSISTYPTYCSNFSVFLNRIVYDDCGLRYKNNAAVIIPACEPVGTLTSPLRVNTTSGIRGVVLVPASDANASSVRIQTSSGVKALRKL